MANMRKRKQPRYMTDLIEENERLARVCDRLSSIIAQDKTASYLEIERLKMTIEQLNRKT